MAGSERIDDSIGKWLEETAPDRLPQRVLEATFERTRWTRQQPAWRGISVRLRMPRFVPALGGAAAAVIALVVALNVIPLIDGPGASPSPSSPSPSTSPAPTTGAWPQSTLEDVKAAQERADAGDPRYTWQLRVDGGQLGQHHPCSGASIDCWRRAKNGGSGEIFIRFLEEKLGWEAYYWDEALSHSGVEGLDPGDVVFVRCAVGVANPLYPTDPERPGCTPTIDDLRYETVKINVAQPDRQGPTGIWLVTAWEIIKPAEQVAPASEAETTALVDAFAQARIDGAGAEAFADFPISGGAIDEHLTAREIPLLYATSTGARYERSTFEVVEGPVWPVGRSRIVLRMFAEGGQTTVEQHFSLAREESDRLRLEYEFNEGPQGGPGTTENGNAVPMEYGFLNGAVTYRAAYPLGPSEDEPSGRDRLAVGGLLPDDDNPRQILLFMADPRPLSLGCGAPAPADADALARDLRSAPGSKATAPVAVTAGALSGLQMNGVIAHATTPCVLLQPTGSSRARLYLFDLPGGSARVLGVAVSADEDSFQTVLEWATPVIDSLEFHAP